MDNPEQEIVETEVKRFVVVPLSTEETAALGEKLAETEIRLAAKRAEKKREDGVFNKAIKDLEGEVAGYAKNVMDGTTEVEVDCIQKKDYPHNRFTVARVDTGGVIEDRALTPAEMQDDLFAPQDAEQANKDSVIPLNQEDQSTI